MPARVLAGIAALLVWELAARLVGNRLLLVGPWEVLKRLITLLPTADFLHTVLATSGRVTAGFLTAFLTALVLAAVSARFPPAELLLRPWLLAVRAVPVASFIVIAMLWLSGQRVSIFISFLMVLPILYGVALEGLKAADPKLLEMAAVYRMPTWNQIRCIRLPALRPYLTAGCRSALGLCWKAGVAAEVISVSRDSVGGKLYEAKIYLEIPDLFAWTLIIVVISLIFEKLFLRLLGVLMDRLEGIE